VTQLSKKVLANDAIEYVVTGPLQIKDLTLGSEYRFKLTTVAIRDMSDEELMVLSKKGQLYLSIAEMKTVQDHFRSLQRDPTDIELETIAQTWSEHCSHKTLGGRIHYVETCDGKVVRDTHFNNMLKETIFAATVQIRRNLGKDDWCVSVFKDNAGIVKFDDKQNVCIKVETHNHPSAIEPYGGANTGSSPGLQHRRLLFRASGLSSRSTTAGRAASAGRDAGSRLRSSRLRQSYGHSDRQRCGLLR
jgi:hypothetical protein